MGVFEKVMKALNGHMACKLKGRMLNQDSGGYLGQSSVEALQTPNPDAETTGKRQGPFKTHDIIIRRADLTLRAPQSGRIPGGMSNEWHKFGLFYSFCVSAAGAFKGRRLCFQLLMTKTTLTIGVSDFPNGLRKSSVRGPHCA
jgi:hypothetical protein